MCAAAATPADNEDYDDVDGGDDDDAANVVR